MWAYALLWFEYDLKFMTGFASSGTVLKAVDTLKILNSDFINHSPKNQRDYYLNLEVG